MTFVLKNVELRWPKLAQPVSPFGDLIWEFQMVTKVQGQADNWKKHNFNVKEKDGVWFVNVSKHAIKKDGTPAKPINVMNGRLEPLDPATLGNESIANIEFLPSEWSHSGRSGIKNHCLSMQVVKHVVFGGSSGSAYDVVDMDVIGDIDPPAPKTTTVPTSDSDEIW